MSAVHKLHQDHGVQICTACEALCVPRTSYYTAQKGTLHGPHKPRRSHRRLSQEEQAFILELLDSEEYVDKSPYQVFADLLEQGIYVCSVSTMYRLLKKRAGVRERRHQLRHPKYATPRLAATGPNQVWSWDITKLPGAKTWTSYYLYVILDMYSRCVVGWMLADKENSKLATKLIEETCHKQGIGPDQLVLHSDRGAPMTSLTTGQLLAKLGVTKSHSRPRVSNDNAFSEAQFKTLKYHEPMPRYFATAEDARHWCRRLVEWYNLEHHHESLGWMTPHQVHYEDVEELVAKRQKTMEAALARHPERFVRKQVRAPRPPEVVHLNKLEANASIH